MKKSGSLIYFFCLCWMLSAQNPLDKICILELENANHAEALLSLSKAVFDPNVTSPQKIGELLKPFLEKRFRSINELDVEFMLDGSKWEAGEAGEGLLVDR